MAQKFGALICITGLKVGSGGTTVPAPSDITTNASQSLGNLSLTRNNT